MLNLKYQANGEPVLAGLKRISKPGLRIYTDLREYAPRHEGPGHRNYFHLQGAS